MICQVCGAANDLDQEFCRKCQNKLLVVSGSSETYDEGPSGEGISLDEHLLERVSVLEEIVKRSAETLKALLEGFHRQEKNGFVIQTGLLALKDLLERKGLLVEQEFVELWEGRVDQHMTVLEKRERFLERKERILAEHKGPGRERLVDLLGEAELAFFALDPEKAMAILEEAWKLDRGNAELAFFLGESWFNDGEAGKAAPALKHVLERRPQHFEALVYSGVLENDLGRPENAVDYLKRALALRPDAFLPAFALGAIHAGAGQLAKAEALLKRAVQIEENPQALSLLGTIAYERGRLTGRHRRPPAGGQARPGRRGRPVPARPLLPRPGLDAEGGRAVPGGARAEPEPDRAAGGEEAPRSRRRRAAPWPDRARRPTGPGARRRWPRRTRRRRSPSTAGR